VLSRLWRAMWSRQEFVFLVVGTVNTLAAYLIFVGLYVVLPGVPYLAILLLCYGIASAISFVSQRTLVFKVKGNWGMDFLRFHITGGVVLALNAGVLVLLVEVVGLDVVPAQLVATLVSVLLSYLGHRLFSFRRHPNPTPSSSQG
jgi:putative flippase GtrA